jgi:hypothetical protein
MKRLEYLIMILISMFAFVGQYVLSLWIICTLYTGFCGHGYGLSIGLWKLYFICVYKGFPDRSPIRKRHRDKYKERLNKTTRIRLSPISILQFEHINIIDRRSRRCRSTMRAKHVLASRRHAELEELEPAEPQINCRDRDPVPLHIDECGGPPH